MIRIAPCFALAASSPEDRARRIFDLLVAVLALALILPLLLLIAVAIRTESRGPVLFGQVRLGRNGRQFVMYKFRKFRADADPDGSPLTRRDDARMTVVGRLLMLAKLDELPQLWNVLRGEMAIVGPRPESLTFADCFQGEFERLLDHRPGLVGPCQILFRNEAAFYAGTDADAVNFYRSVLFPIKALIDLDYLRRRTVLTDARLIFYCAAAVCGVPISRIGPESAPLRPLSDVFSDARATLIESTPSDHLGTIDAAISVSTARTLYPLGAAAMRE
ncbi:sugar transferase [Methylobacterium sp. CM6257]